MIVVATSGANDCVYCIVAHGAILRVREAPARRRSGRANYRKADITPRQKVMLAFALKVAPALERDRRRGLRRAARAGFGDEDIWDIGAIAAFFALSNRMANLISMRPTTSSSCSAAAAQQAGLRARRKTGSPQAARRRAGFRAELRGTA